MSEIEEVLKFFNPSCALFSYQKLLLDDISQMKNKGEAQHVVSAATRATTLSQYSKPYIEETEDCRNEIRKIHDFDFLHAQLQEPLKYRAPWVEDFVDFNELPWSSTILEQQGGHKKTATQTKKQTNTEFDSGNFEKKTRFHTRHT